MSTKLAYWVCALLTATFLAVLIVSAFTGAPAALWIINGAMLLFAVTCMLQIKASEHVETTLRSRLAVAVARADQAEAELARVRRLYNQGPGWPQ